MNTIRLESFSIDDLEDVISLFRDTVHHVNNADYTDAQLAAWAPPEHSKDVWTNKLTAHYTQLAWSHNQLVGFATLSTKGLVDHLFIHRNYQRQGLAAILYARIEFEAREQQLNRLYTESSITARPFFEKMGFQVIFPQEKEVRGVVMKNYIMEKMLS